MATTTQGWDAFEDAFAVARLVRHEALQPWMAQTFRNWLMFRQQVDIRNLYRGVPISLVFDMYREAFLPEALAWWWLYKFGSDIDNAREVARGILTRTDL